MKDLSNIFNSCCLLQVSCSIWPGKKGIDKKKVKEALDTEWASGKKNTVNKDELKALNNLRTSIHLFVKSYTTPFPIDGINMVSFGLVERVEKELKETFLPQFNELADNFCSKYPELKRQAREELEPKGLYDEKDYPRNIDEHFNLIWRFVTIQAPGENSLLSPEIVKREQQKFIDTIQEAQDLALSVLHDELAKLVRHCVERLTPEKDGTPKQFRKNTIENFQTFFESFKERNVFNNKELTKLVENAKKIISGVNPEQLRDDAPFRDKIRASLAGVSEQINNAIENAPYRKLRIR